MNYRPYPDAARALRYSQRNHALYRYGRFPRRYVLGLAAPVDPSAVALQPDRLFVVEPTRASRLRLATERTARISKGLNRRLANE